MKKLSVIVVLSLFIWGCVTTNTGSTQKFPNTSTSSPESQAKTLTSQMKNELQLDKIQEDKVLNINIVYQKLLQRIKENKEDALVNSTKENYHKELKGVLTNDQFSKFLIVFPEL